MRRAKASPAGSTKGQGSRSGSIRRALGPGLSLSPDGSSAPTRGLSRLALAFALALAALLAFGPPSAFAIQTRVQTSTFGSFANPQAISVDPSSGDVYVVDVNNGSVDRFDSSGNPDNFTGGPDAGTNTLTGFAFDSPSAAQVAIAPAGAPAGTAGDIYVASLGGIDIYANDGTHLGQLTQADGQNFVEACGVATDAAGNVYVGDFGHQAQGAADRYLPTTNPTTNADYDNHITHVPFLCNLAADSTGAVYASSWSDGPLTKYQPSDFGTSNSGTQIDGSSNAVAVDFSTDDVYVDEGGQINQFDSSGSSLATFGANHISGSRGVAVANGGATVYVTSNDGQVHVFGPVVNIDPPAVTIDPPSAASYTSAHLTGTVDPSGNDTSWSFQYSTDDSSWQGLPSHDAGSGSGAINVSDDLTGLQPGTQYFVRLVATNDGGQTVSAGPDPSFTTLPVAPPSIHLDPVSSITPTTAHFSATVNPNAPGAAPQDPAFDTPWHFECSPACSGPQGGTILADNTDTPVADDALDLQPNTTYHVTLSASNAGGSVSDQTVFTTDPAAPLIANATSFDLTPGTITVRANINNFNAELSDCHFELGTSTSYGTDLPCQPNPPAGPDLVTLSRDLTGLTPGTTYHYRLVGTNAAGTSQGPDGSFTTPDPTSPQCANDALRTGLSANLPDCRAYEQVSPVDKNGSDVISDSTTVRMSADGNAATFSSYGGFADVQGTNITADYLAQRNSGGWSTHGITPKVPPNTAGTTAYGIYPNYEALNQDFSAGIYGSPFALTSDPNTQGNDNLYLRTDLHSPGAGTYQLVSPCPLCSAPGGSPLAPNTSQTTRLTFAAFAGASADLSHVLFESVENLTGDAPGNCDGLQVNNQASCPLKLYEWHGGTLSLAGILPDGTPAPQSVAGQGVADEVFYGAGQRPVDTISADGSRIFFMDNSSTGDTQGQLYMRVDSGEPGASTVQLNASERTDCADHDPCSGTPEPDPSGPSPARFWASSSDGSRSFFTTSEALTDDASTSFAKLYMYDASASAGHHLTLLSGDHNPADGITGLQPGDGANDGVIGVSADGHYVYFTSGGQLAAGQPDVNAQGGSGLYLWHDGVVRFIAPWQSQEQVYANIAAREHPFTRGRLDARVTPDGRHLLFASTHGTGPTGYDQGSCPHSVGGNGCTQLYVYSADDNALTCASCNPSGATATQDASASHAGSGVWEGSAYLNRAISDDGRFVFFSSAAKLVPQDVNGRSDAYEYDTQTAQVHLLTSGTSSDDSYFLDTDPVGSNVLVTTDQALVGQDSDGNADAYDVRRNGGIAAQNPAPPPPPCADPSGCHGPGSGPPGLPTSGSSAFSGPGNQAQGHKHKKHKKHKHRRRHARKHSTPSHG